VAALDNTPVSVLIYGLVDPRNGNLRYIGRTKRRLMVRLNGHIQSAKKASDRHVHSWIRGVLMAEMKPLVVLLEETDARSWEEAEQFWIAYFRSLGADLTNIAVGGGGSLGFQHSPARRSYWSENRRGANHPGYGKKRTAEQVEFMNQRRREARAGKPGNRAGVPVSVETRLKMSAAASVRVRAKESYEPVALHMRDLWRDPEWSAKLRGSNQKNAKLTEDQVRAIREDPRSAPKVAVEYGVHRTVVCRIRSRQAWAHVL
jgi:hypothetical protein